MCSVRMNTLRLLVAALCLLCVKSETLTQPQSVTVQPGHPLSIPCTVSYSFGTYVYTAWIRQPAGKGLEWIGIKDSAGNYYRKDSLKNKFSIDVDTSSKTVTLTGQNMQPGDSAVYYCARDWGGGYRYFDYWGQGTQVTITSANPIAPVVFPVMPCSYDSAEITLACLASGFTPSTVKFSWTKNGTAVDDFLQYPSVLKNELYSGVSQIRVRRQDWDSHSYKCKVEHQAGIREVDFIKPLEIYELPSLKVMTMEEDRKVTLSCLANNFVPNVYEFKWLKNDREITNTSLQFTTPSKSQKSDNGTRYTAASFLTLPADDLRDDTSLKCKFNLGKGQKQTTVNGIYQYKPTNLCSGPGPSSSTYNMVITPPSLEDLLYYREGKVRCELTVKFPNKVRNIYWMNEHREILMNMTDPGAMVRGGKYILDLDVTYEEWNRGIKRICFLDHEDSLTGVSQEYVRNNDPSSQKAPSVFMLSPLKHTRDDKVTLTCFIKDFYPKEIYVTWLIDDKITEHEFNTTNSVRSNGAYYVYSHMIIPMSEWAVPEQVYSCVVYHESLEKNQNIVRSITQHSSDQTTMVNLNMKFPDTCKA